MAATPVRWGSCCGFPSSCRTGQILAHSTAIVPVWSWCDPKTGDRRLIAPDLFPAGYVRGYVLYNLQERLVAQRLDATAGALVGDPIPIGDAASQRVFASDQLLSWVTTGAS